MTLTGRKRAAEYLALDEAGPVWRSRSPIVALLLAVVFLPALLFGFSAWTGYRETLRAAEARAERTTRVLEEHVSKIFEGHRLIIQQVREHLRFTDWSREADRADLHALLRRLQDDLNQVATITIVDAAGHLRASGRAFPADPNLDFSDRDWFQMLRAGATGAVISRSYKGRQSGQPVFNIAVALQDRTGAFDGAIAVSLDRRYFEAFYKEVEPDFDHSVTLVRSDGEILARVPASDLSHLPASSHLLATVAHAPAGHYVGVSAIDGVQRLFAYRKVADYPVYVRFGISTGAVLAPWKRSLVDYGFVSLFSACALAFSSWLVLRQTQRERVARRRWQETAAALEAEVAKRERVDAQLRQLQKMEAIGRLTGGIAHDFNNLLTAVLGNLELALRRIEDARVARLVSNAVDGAQRAAALTSRLLSFSRKQPLQLKQVALPDLVAGMDDLLRVTLGETITLRYLPSGDVWPVAVDVSQLENAILNLAANARDAMPDGGALTITVQNSRLGAESEFVVAGEIDQGEYALISVRDTGEGMSSDILAQVFEPFFTTKPIGKGSGLGLSQVYGFARQSGGQVIIRSAPGQGTTIRIFLPRRHLTIGEMEAPQAQRARAADRASGETILVVEDQDMVRSFAVSVLREAGYATIEAEDGASALTLLAAHPEVSLLFTDVVLKGAISGCALAEAARRSRGLPVLFTSGHSRDDIVRDGKLEVDDELLQKPFTGDALTGRIRALLDAEAPSSLEAIERPRTLAG